MNDKGVVPTHVLKISAEKIKTGKEINKTYLLCPDPAFVFWFLFVCFVLCGLLVFVLFCFYLEACCLMHHNSKESLAQH